MIALYQVASGEPLWPQSALCLRWRDESGHAFRSCGNENREFDEHGLMRTRTASIDDLPMPTTECENRVVECQTVGLIAVCLAQPRMQWPAGRRRATHGPPCVDGTWTA